MTKDSYHIEISPHFVAYDFVSEGPRGKILKGIRYTQTDFANVWNLGFGDIDLKTGEINDTIVSDNGDSEKVLATVARSCVEFSKHFPEAMIFAIGSTSARTRLYQMGVSRQYDEISELFWIWGLLNEEWEEFEKNKNYQALLVKRK